MAKLLKADGTNSILNTPSFEDIQKAVGGYVELVRIPGDPDHTLAVNEEGGMRGLSHNAQASAVAGQPIVGDAVIVSKDAIK